jgi:iron-sulfur cluster assembly protein
MNVLNLILSSILIMIIPNNLTKFATQIMVTISENAKNELLALMKTEKDLNKYVRVGVSSGGCSGLSYNLDFDSKKLETDKVFENNGITLLVDEKSYLYLMGTTLNYSGGLNGKGFVFENPNASRTCGCGESFAL